MAEYEEEKRRQHNAVDHGLKGVVTIETALKKNDLKAIESIQMRQEVAMGVDQARKPPPAMLQKALIEELVRWKEYAANPKTSGRAKYQKLVAKAEPLTTLPAG